MNSGMQFRRYGLGLLLGALGMSSAHAIQIRGYSSTRHDRFTGYPGAPILNTASWFSGSSYTGVGWSVSEVQKQFALVSPKHVVCASHYVPSVGDTIRFLSSGGTLVDRTVSTIQSITDTNGDATDLTLCTLATAITPAEGVTSLPYLSLLSGETYTAKHLTVFGWNAKVGSSSITAFFDYTNPDNNAETRIVEYKYKIASGSQDDAFLEGGDSGSPSFATVNGQPALVGLHFLAGSDSSFHYSYDTLVPYYITKLNTLMGADGYTMTPLATTARLGLAISTSPTTLREGNAGSSQLTVSNARATTAANVKVTLEFPAGSAPTSVTATGWTITNNSPVWELTRSSLSGLSSASITATWASLPLLATLPVKTTYVADGSALSTVTTDLTLNPSFASWASGLTDTTQAGDPDNDGVSNLVEYAFGSSATSGSTVSANGFVLLPVLTTASGAATLEFPVRSDAAARGITYSVEYSQTLESSSWSTTPPSGASAITSAYSPDWAGFYSRQISFPATDTRQFARVKIILSE